MLVCKSLDCNQTVVIIISRCCDNKSFWFVVDIKYEDIDENLWKSGMAWNQGFDVDGNNVG